MEWAFSVEKRQNGGRLNQKALCVPLGSFQLVWRTDLEVDLERTQNYCVELFALYLRRTIVEIRFSMMLLAFPGAAETMPSRGPHGKTSTCCNSLPVRKRSFFTRKQYPICRSLSQIETYSLG